MIPADVVDQVTRWLFGTTDSAEMVFEYFYKKGRKTVKAMTTGTWRTADEKCWNCKTAMSADTGKKCALCDVTICTTCIDESGDPLVPFAHGSEFEAAYLFAFSFVTWLGPMGSRHINRYEDIEVFPPYLRARMFASLNPEATEKLNYLIRDMIFVAFSLKDPASFNVCGLCEQFHDAKEFGRGRRPPGPAAVGTSGRLVRRTGLYGPYVGYHLNQTDSKTMYHAAMLWGMVAKGYVDCEGPLKREFPDLQFQGGFNPFLSKSPCLLERGDTYGLWNMPIMISKQFLDAYAFLRCHEVAITGGERYLEQLDTALIKTTFKNYIMEWFRDCRHEHHDAASSLESLNNFTFWLQTYERDPMSYYIDPTGPAASVRAAETWTQRTALERSSSHIRSMCAEIKQEAQLVVELEERIRREKSEEYDLAHGAFDQHCLTEDQVRSLLDGTIEGQIYTAVELIGIIRPPLTEIQCGMITEIVRERPTMEIRNAYADACGVCMEELDDLSAGKGRPVALPCGHIFHHDCVKGWVVARDHKSCPYCRKESVTALAPLRLRL
jgi:hypothetical protein